MKLGKDLYCGKCGEYSVQDYYDAWEMRENCPIYFKKENIIKNMPKYQELVPYLKPDNMNKNEKAEQLFRYYHNIENKKREEVICIRLGDEHLHDYNHKYYYITEAELDLYEAIQDFLMTRYEKQGLSIEVCPSSNITIGGFDIKEHPIFRWQPLDENDLKKCEKFNKYNLRNGKISCCINTDDPGIFPTTIQNEFKLLKNCAIEEYKASETRTKEWCESLREEGVDIFMRNWIQD